MVAEREADTFLLVFPAGIAAPHRSKKNILQDFGKQCVAIGTLEKTETLYNIFDKIFPTIKELEDWLRTQPKA